MSLQTLQIYGQLSPEFGRKHARVTWGHGDGYDPSQNIGSTDGVLYYRYIFKVLPNRSTHVITDPEDGNAIKTHERYLRDFFGYRETDGQPFLVLDQRQTLNNPEAVYEKVVFAEHTLQETLFSKNLYRCEIRLRQYRDIDE